MFQPDLEEWAKRLGVPSDSPEVVERVGVASIGAMQILESQLEILFSKGSRIDLVHLDTNLHQGLTPAGLLRVRLTTGFIETPIVTVGDRWNEVDSTVPDGDMVVSEEYGLVSVDADKYANKFLKVAYSYGFDRYDDFPESIKQALVGWTRVVLLNGNGLGTQELEREYKAVKEVAVALTARAMRPVGFSFKPIV